MNDGLNDDAIMDILEVLSKIKFAPSDRFEGARIDFGAQRTVIGNAKQKYSQILQM